MLVDGVGLPHAHRNVSDPEFGAQKGEPPVLVTGVKGLERPREDPSPRSKLRGRFAVQPAFPLRKPSGSLGASPGLRVGSKLPFHLKIMCEVVKRASGLKWVESVARRAELLLGEDRTDLLELLLHLVVIDANARRIFVNSVRSKTLLSNVRPLRQVRRRELLALVSVRVSLWPID